MWDWGGPQVNKFEQVSTDDHQLSLAGGLGLGVVVPCLGWAGGAPHLMLV